MLFQSVKQQIPKSLRDKYLIPPFSILDSKHGDWLARRNEWETILENRDDNVRDEVADGNTPYVLSDYWREQFHVRDTRLISTFDPFLAEILIKWFSIENMTILDPFAGGLVRGAVASILNRKYVGIDISKEQLEHNVKQWERIEEKYNVSSRPVYFLEDAETALDDFSNAFDMMLTCPPYYDLEHYTEEAQDLSNLDSYDDFLKKYTAIIQKCYNALKEDSFAVIVVSEIRDKNGIFYGFVPDTINAFRQAGFKYYNEMILENRSVSLSVRCPKYFEQSRKVGKHHQNILVFYKGNTNNIESKLGRFTVGE